MKTSFRFATGLTLAEAVAKDKAVLPDAFADGVFCDNYSERSVTWPCLHSVWLVPRKRVQQPTTT